MGILPILFHGRRLRVYLPRCFWENDPFIASDDDPSDSNHGITLNEAKANYLEFGACEEEMLRYVRPPESDENGHS